MTLYSDVYTKFLEKISDYQFINVPQQITDAILLGYLHSASAKFVKCKTDLSNRDETNLQFNNTLTDLEIEILVLYMMIEWLSPQIYNIMLLKQTLNAGDFKIYSQSQHLHELKDLKSQAEQDVESLVIKYAYANCDFSSLG